MKQGRKKEFARVGETESSRMSVYIMIPRDGPSFVLDMAITSCYVVFLCEPAREDTWTEFGFTARTGRARRISDSKITLKMGAATERMREDAMFCADCSVENNTCVAATQVSRPGHGERCLRAVCGGVHRSGPCRDSQGRSSGASQWPHLGRYTID